MALYINADECISCGDCERVCPTDSIKEGLLAFEIDAATCTECEGDFDAPKCVEVCEISNCILPLNS